MSVDIVIGANFGDEGKGLMTDFLARKYNCNTTVVRFNGGAQAGHTVQLESGERHVFHHFGSGSFAKADTYLSEYFICNPIVFKDERVKLNNLAKLPQFDDMNLNVTIHPNSIITTPYDMILNQGKETQRDTNRHGSCGVGVHETIVRNKKVEFKVSDLQGNYLDILIRVRLFCKLKAEALELDEKTMNFINDVNVFKQYLHDLQFFKDHIHISDYTPLSVVGHLIFEGAQGLLLDQDHSYYPHVTHSKTGMKNVLKILNKLTGGPKPSKEKFNVYYMSRSYMTRHGVGPFNSEDELEDYNITDETNIPNEWQGSLRFGPLDIGLLSKSIKQDAPDNMTINLVLTCIDQLPENGKLDVYDSGAIYTGPVKMLYEDIAKAITPNIWISEGPTRSTISKL